MNKTISKQTIEKMLRKLSQPVHINYIASHLLRLELSEAKKVIETLIKDGVVEESEYAKEYYQVKQK